MSDRFNLIDALTVLFIALKLTGSIEWSWLWVLSPIWAELLVTIISAVIIELRKRGDE